MVELLTASMASAQRSRGARLGEVVQAGRKPGAPGWPGRFSPTVPGSASAAGQHGAAVAALLGAAGALDAAAGER